ncbi:MAG: MarR family winged helix-turn-helix transcriptional regulator [Anaeroplasmataceae bacterium]
MNKKHLGYYVKVLSQAYESFKNIDLREFDLTSQQFEVLMYLYRHENDCTNQKDIEHLLDVTAATASGILKRLELKGYIIRKVSNNDSRYKEIIITSKGKEFKDVIIKRMDDNEKSILKGISIEEEQTLIELLKKVIVNVKKEK